jgi:ubiquinone/menaquinone biosynthesis C-methylase UbiE
MKTAEPVQGNVLSPQQIMELASGFMRSRAFLTACELDLFTAVGSGEATSAEVARTLGTDRRATDRLLNVLCSLGLLQKAADRFRNGPAAARFLVRDAPEYLGGLMHWVHLWESWSTLTPAVRQGGAVTAAPVDERGEQWLRAFIAAMHWRACQHAPAVVAALDLTAVSRVLDVGGGSGAYAMEFVRAAPGLRAVVFDLPNILPFTAGYLAQAGLADRVALVAGDYDRDDLGGGFDLVFLSAIIHSNSPDGNRALINKAVAALNPRGQLVVQDFIVDETRTGPPFGALFALNMLVGTAAGDTYTESEARQWMTEAGLSGMARTDTEFGTSLLIGRKASDT